MLSLLLKKSLFIFLWSVAWHSSASRASENLPSSKNNLISTPANQLNTDKYYFNKLLPPPSEWTLPIKTQIKTLQPDIRTLRARIEASKTNPEFADPIQLKIEGFQQNNFIKQLSNNNNIATKELEFRNPKQSFTILPKDLAWLNLDKLANILRIKTFSPSFSLEDWNNTEKSNFNFAMYFNQDFKMIKKTIDKLQKQNQKTKEVLFSQILPPTVRNLYGRYSHLRGRNCFGTALDFFNQRHLYSKIINTEKEKDHFSTMINSDEFLQALWLGYYELDGTEIISGLKWGDVVVLYDPNPDFSWVSLKHAMVHLAGNYYFQKASKSAASPIEITSWDNVVGSWQQLIPNLDYKVFRRLPAISRNVLTPEDAIERLLWTR